MRKGKFILLILGFLTIVFAGSCYYDNEEVLYPSLMNPCDTTNVTYSKNVSKILSSYCYSCHGSTYLSTGSGIKLDTYNDVKQSLNSVIGALNHNPMYSSMPKNAGKLSNCLIRQIEIWKEAGTPNN